MGSPWKEGIVRLEVDKGNLDFFFFCVYISRLYPYITHSMKVSEQQKNYFNHLFATPTSRENSLYFTNITNCVTHSFFVFHFLRFKVCFLLFSKFDFHVNLLSKTQNLVPLRLANSKSPKIQPYTEMIKLVNKTAYKECQVA